MSNIKFTKNILKKVKADLDSKIINNHISHISVINSTDVLLQFSFWNKERLLISLNHQSPFLSMVDKNFVLSAVLNNFNENLRRLIKASAVNKIEILNDDRVIEFTLFKTNDFFEKETMYLILELIPTRSNLVILDSNRNIVYAYHYFDLTHPRPMIKGTKYIPLENTNKYVDNDDSYEEFQKEVTSYLLSAERKRKIESQKPLFNFLNTKRKSLKKKLEVLRKEKNKAIKGLIYKEYGDMIYAYLYDEETLNNYINEYLLDIYDNNLSPTDNANKMYKIYKKNKRTIEYDDIEFEKANKELEEIEHYLAIFDYLDEEEINELYNKYLSFKNKNKKKVRSDSRLPYYIKFNNTVIGFGKNANQNNYLTFKLANKTDTFLHAKDYHGAHVIIFNNNPSNEELLIASEICLILSNLAAGDIEYTKVSEIKKGQELGQALLRNYKLITLKEIREKTHELLLNQKRFSN